MHLTAKFRHPKFNRLGVIVLTKTDWQTNKQTDTAENIHLAPLCFAGDAEVKPSLEVAATTLRQVFACLPIPVQVCFTAA